MFIRFGFRYAHDVRDNEEGRVRMLDTRNIHHDDSRLKPSSAVKSATQCSLNIPKTIRSVMTARNGEYGT